MPAVNPVRIGISRCLLGDGVRYDGGHKRDAFLTDVLGRFVEWVPVCPEVEAGLGTPREAMRLVGHDEGPRLITIKHGTDHTQMMTRFSERRVRELDALDLSGYVFKKGSPSCGIERVRLYNEHGMPTRNGVGLFAQAVMERFPLIPVEEEGRLNDPVLRENFIERMFCYRRWRDLTAGRVTRGAIVSFHTAHKYLLLAHSQAHYQALGRLVADAKRHVLRSGAPLRGAVHGGARSQGHRAQARQRAAPPRRLLHGAALDGRAGGAARRDRRLPQGADAAGRSADPRPALRPPFRHRVPSRADLFESPSKRTDAA
jgi:uncharacterized protein YbbK (DUF523 family)